MEKKTKWKEGLSVIVLTILVFYYFLILGVFTFRQQEEAQLFVPAWSNVKAVLCEPGGFCAVAGQYLILHYTNPLFAVTANTLLLVAIAWGMYRLLERVSGRSYHLFLACLPVFYLMKESIQYVYVIDGTIAIALMLAFLYPLTCLKTAKRIAAYGIVSTCVLFLLAGQMAVLYAATYALSPTCFYGDRHVRWQGAWSLLPAIPFYLFSGRMGVPVPLSEGFRPVQFLETQLQPIYYIYHVWIRFTACLLFMLAVAFLLSKAACRKRWTKAIISLSCLLLLAAQGINCMPKRIDIRNYLLNELAYFAREKRWDAIIDRFQGRQMSEYVSLNYLNYALSQKGELAERMFAFDQRGPKSLVMPWTQTFFDSKLLCDIHFHIGDLSLAEGYAFEAMALAQREGCLPALQRLVQINLLKGEYALAHKYIHVLSEVPAYADWAGRQSDYILHPERMDEDPELRNRRRPYLTQDKLLLQMPADSLWQAYTPEQTSGWEYGGCYYLTDKKIGPFKDFILRSCAGRTVELPRHFQEAWLLAADLDATLPPGRFVIRKEIKDRYRRFRQAMQGQSAGKADTDAIYRSFGDTYWFYFYFKLFKSNETNKGI